MAVFFHFWNFALALFAIISLVTALRVKRQGSQMDPLLRAVCEGLPDGAYKHPYACGSYIQCFGGSYSEADCPGNMYFNTKAKSCDFRRRVKCKIVDGLIETDEDSVKFGPEVPVQVDHPVIPRPAV